ncbi:hypothetical protein QPK87_31465 [Kamptonema cortianum]|nr:hypothetical protein [Kamptonema cortianum]
MSDHHAPPTRSVARAIQDFFSPRYHYERFREDLVATREALKKRKELLAGEAHHASLPEIFRGKLMGVFFATGWTNLIGIGLGYVLQKAYSSQWVGLFSTPLLCFVVTGLAFQFAWWIDNRAIYKAAAPDPAHRFLSFQRDMGRVHLASLPFAIVFNIVNVSVVAPILGIITLINPALGKETPAGALIILVEFLFIGGSYVRVMGDFFDKFSYVLATRYREVCARVDQV